MYANLLDRALRCEASALSQLISFFMGFFFFFFWLICFVLHTEAQ